jgi:uncharacterized membrane protein YesL
VRNYWEEGFNLLVINVIWSGAQVLIVTGPPATAALFAVTNRVAHGGFARLSEFRDAFKEFFGASWKWGALNLAAIVVFGFAAIFYGSGVFDAYGAMLSLLMWWLLGTWLFLQMFAFPMWLEQTDRRIGLALRNAAVMTAHHVRLTLLALVLTVIAVALIVPLPPLAVMVTPAFLATLGNTIVVAQAEALREKE